MFIGTPCGLKGLSLKFRVTPVYCVACPIHNSTFKPLLINNLSLQGFNPENFLLVTGCPNKHGNSVTNSISSFQMIL